MGKRIVIKTPAARSNSSEGTRNGIPGLRPRGLQQDSDISGSDIESLGYYPIASADDRTTLKMGLQISLHNSGGALCLRVVMSTAACKWGQDLVQVFRLAILALYEKLP